MKETNGKIHASWHEATFFPRYTAHVRSTEE